MAEAFYNNLLVELECPICTNYMSPPIRQCSTGHNTCENCYKKLQQCPMCKGKFSDARNLALEAIAVKMRYPCINKNAGCTASLTYMERETHELRCNMRGLKCPMENCKWTGRLEEIVAHWKSKSVKRKPYGPSNICRTKIKFDSYYVNLVEAYNEIFWFKCKLIDNRFYWSVQYLGKQANSENYFFEIEIFKPGVKLPKIVLSDNCQNADLDNSELFKLGTCISIDNDSVKDFFVEEPLLMLLYYLRISKKGNNMQQDKQMNRQPRSKSRGPSNMHKSISVPNWNPLK